MKTNVMRLLDVNNIPHQEYSYDSSITNGVEVAKALNEDVDQVFKTLVTIGNDKNHYVFCIPVAKELNLKKAAKAVGVKSIEMIKQKELLPLTGYIHGGCSPIGMKKEFKTVIDETCILYDSFCISGGRVGFQVALNYEDLKKILNYDLYSLID